MAPHDGVSQLPTLVAAPLAVVDDAPPSSPTSFDEKADVKILGRRTDTAASFDSADAKAEGGPGTLYDELEGDSTVQLVNGEPVITDGRDVSRFLIDPRDDGDAALTFRSLCIGTVLAGLGAALCQIYLFKPIQMTVSTVFLMLIIYSIGKAWARWLPTANGKLTPSQHVVASLVASTAAGGSTAVMNFAVQRLYYDTNVEATTAVLATFSTACFGYGLVGILRPLSVYPSEMVYWANLPTVTIFQSIFAPTPPITRLKLFWASFTGMFIWEIFPAYIFPLLNGINIFCLTTQHVPSGAQDYIGSSYLSFPLIQQANSWVGYVICYIVIMGIYYTNAWNSLAFPMLSTSLFAQNGTVYNQRYVFGPTFTLNETALEEIGLPALTGSNAWANLTANLGIGGLSFKQARDKSQPDPHWKIVNMRYKEVPWYWYGASVRWFAGQTTLPWWSYILALLVEVRPIPSAFITPFSTILFARMGNGIATNQLMKWSPPAQNSSHPVGLVQFSMWSHDVVNGQYLKIPPRVMFLTQIWGTILGTRIVNYVVMISVVDAQREILLQPRGTNIWSGQYPQSLNSAAVTWSLAKELYGPSGPYFWIPLSLLLGMIPTAIQWLIVKRYPTIRGFRVDSVVLPIIYQYSSWMSAGTNSPVFASVLVGLASQLWLRRYHPAWFRKYNYVLGGALDGGAQVMVFVLSFAVFGASGVPRPFPAWAGNPAVGNVDYCNGNGALD
ncbi:oligopeptide transporter [Epithele typhae]|uniref:oligopeptide transporter n=1 Tax=Epithele typhae TaxID=378194 RepID=UPI0020074500|nr:oligopeptide transporter [Epithele typhae]KAH9914494.1 oligopeptide transporter [Epithele typhae]